jgi:hypothetical protein
MDANEAAFYNMLSEMAALFDLEGTDEALQTSIALRDAIGMVRLHLQHLTFWTT